MMLRHIAAFVISAATVVAVHLSSFQSELAACDAKSGRAVTRVYDLRGMHKVAVRNHALIPPAKPYYTNGCWSPRRYVDPAIPPTIAEFADEVCWVICDAVEPASWPGNGGSDGYVHAVDGRLIITHTPEAHARIHELLNAIEALGAAEPPRG